MCFELLCGAPNPLTLGIRLSCAAPPAPPFPTPGPDPTDNDPLDCASWP